ncbi:FAD-binding monooxygenase ktnD [Colletotrichum sp. SAR11_59]|nr:FAD-binding monooxygenase ktnD [Colletotrichum sp. SAR11_59]
MSKYAKELNAIIIGAGPAGIAMAYRLKHELHFDDFTIYEKLDGVGGTWRTNTYPGCGCDLKSHLYSFSFNMNPNWSKELCEQPEILQYMEDTCSKFDLHKHIHTSVECMGARWHTNISKWEIFLDADEETTTYFPTPKGLKARAEAEAESKKYIKSVAPKKYWDHIIPNFPLGCKRRIFDPGYLESLNLSNVELLPEGIKEITETGIISSSGIEDDFDIIVLATGFQVSQFLTPMHIVGSTGISLHDQWKQCRGAQAYLGTHVHNFPNLAILFGPNTFPANNSALFACETQVDYAIKSLFTPLIDHKAAVIEVKQSAEDRETNAIHKSLRDTVFSGDCSNWYIGDYGRNAASWPGLARSFWFKTYFPDWSAFNMSGGSALWPLLTIRRWLSTMSPISTVFALVSLAAAVSRYRGLVEGVAIVGYLETALRAGISIVSKFAQ